MVFDSTFIWHHTQTSYDSQGAIDWQTHKYILTPPLDTTATCITLNKQLAATKINFAEVHNVFPYQKLPTCRSHIDWLDSTTLSPSCETQRLLMM